MSKTVALAIVAVIVIALATGGYYAYSQGYIGQVCTTKIVSNEGISLEQVNCVSKGVTYENNCFTPCNQNLTQFVSSVYSTAYSINANNTSSQTETSSMDVQIVSCNLTVAFQSGLWQMSLYNAGSVAVSKIAVYLETPTPSEVCSGSTVSSGLSFNFCTVAPSGNPLPPGSTLTGEASGIGEGSATVGSHYPVAAKILFTNGDTVWVNSTVTANNPS